MKTTKQLLEEALNHLYLHRELPGHVPNATLYAEIEGHLKGYHTGGIVNPRKLPTIVSTEQVSPVPVKFCPDCGGALYPWQQNHSAQCPRLPL